MTVVEGRLGFCATFVCLMPFAAVSLSLQKAAFCQANMRQIIRIMIISELRLFQFKNHMESHFELSPHINCFVGDNGIGKTNVLDALHYLSMGKSFLLQKDPQNMARGTDAFVIDALVLDDQQEACQLKIQYKDKKIIKKNDKAYARMADHIGFLPSVCISPYDNNLISEGSEARRKYLDQMISQTNSQYLQQLLMYQKILLQRNALLKNYHQHNYLDMDTLVIYNERLSESGHYIYEKRREFIAWLTPLFQAYYQQISQDSENVALVYDSQLADEPLPELLANHLGKDKALGYTSKGIHRDDILLIMNQNPIKMVGSQGQQKTYLIALKLAQLELYKQLSHKKPILLLDDIFDKLDDHRVSQLIGLLNQNAFGQLFITDTHYQRTEAIVKRINEDSKMFKLG
jgi:DNA replication and repair protein RecF